MAKNNNSTKMGGAREIIASIIRMSQKALGCILIMVAIGFVGGLIAIYFEPDLADPMTEYARVYIPLFQLEIGVYGAGSTVENVMKIKTQIGGGNKETPIDQEITVENG